MSFIDGTIYYSDLVLSGKLTVDQAEMAVLKKALDLKILKSSSPTGFQDFHDLLEVFKLSNHVATLREIFEKFNLDWILQDRSFIQCYGMASKYTCKMFLKVQVQLKKSNELLSEIQERLYLKGSVESQCLDILVHIRNCRELHKFIAAKKFYGEKGLDSCRRQYRLITTRLQHMNYDESVLNNLPDAVNMIAPLHSINESCSNDAFKEVMFAIVDNSKFSSTKLQNVNRNMSLIQRWFSHASVSSFNLFLFLNLNQYPLDL